MENKSYSTIAEILSAVDSKKVDPVFALAEELNGKRRVTLITALEERIEAETPMLETDDEFDDDIHHVELTPKAEVLSTPEPKRVPGKGEMRCALKSDAPVRVELRGTVVRTFDRKDSPFIVSCDYWRAVLSRTGHFVKVNE